MRAEILILETESENIAQFLEEHGYFDIAIDSSNQPGCVVLSLECNDVEFLMLYVTEARHRSQQKHSN